MNGKKGKRSAGEDCYDTFILVGWKTFGRMRDGSEVRGMRIK